MFLLSSDMIMGWVFVDGCLGWLDYLRRTRKIQIGLCVAMVDCDVLPLLVISWSWDEAVLRTKY